MKLKTSETVDFIEPSLPEPVPHKLLERRKHGRTAEPGSGAERSIRRKDGIYTESRLTGENASDIARRRFASKPK